MRLKMDYQFDKREAEFVEHIKRDLIGKIAVEHLVGLLKHESSNYEPNDRVRGDFYVITREQAKRLIDSIPYPAHEVISILDEEIPELKIPFQ